MSEDLFTRLHELLNVEDHASARALINQALTDVEGIEPGRRLMSEVELYGFLCDVGSESGNQADLERCIAYMQANEAAICAVIHRSSYYYNLANAQSSLAKIQLRRDGVVSPYVSKAVLHAAITTYWMAFKCAEGASLKNQIAINLSNTLPYAGRFIESLQFLDIVLKESPSFPQALFSRADGLHSLPYVTNGGLTASLFAQQFANYDSALKTGKVIPSIASRAEVYMADIVQTLAEYGFGLPDIENEIKETTAEYMSLSAFRRFSIDHFVTLNEHSIYCPCIASKWDDLQIGLRHLCLAGRIVPKMEMLLNRVKAEFAMARSMFYDATVTGTEFSMDAKFTELFECEVLSASSEMLRSSFRQCYGILDKLAVGIYELYGIEASKLYFESFWSNDAVKEKLIQVKNIHLNALHSISCDLNVKHGELRHFKNWRNALEHRLLVLHDQTSSVADPLGLLSDKFIEVVDLTEFKVKTLHLLQLTRAAIFSFTYCVRLETVRPLDDLQGAPFVVDFRK